MKIHLLFAIIAVYGLSHGAQAATIVERIEDITLWVGSGENRAGLVIDWNDGKNAPGDTAGEALAWGYQWPVGETRTGQQMLEAIAAADPRLVLMGDFRGGGPIVFGLAYDLDGDGGSYTFDLIDEQGSASDSGDHFQEGWEVNGFWGYRVSNDSSVPTWQVAGNGFATRTLANNSWDAWVFSTDLRNFTIPLPSDALAAPEPGTAALLAVGSLLLYPRRRR